MACPAEVREGQVTAQLITGLALDDAIARVSRIQGEPAVRSFITDALGSVLAQASAQQEVEGAYAYSPYGETRALGADETGNPIQYTGRENDGTGLYYYRARYCDPVMKRFISRAQSQQIMNKESDGTIQMVSQRCLGGQVAVLLIRSGASGPAAPLGRNAPFIPGGDSAADQ